MKDLLTNSKILLGTNNGFTLEVNKWLLTIGALLSIIIGAFFLFRFYSGTAVGEENLILGISILIISIYQLFYAWTAFSLHSSLALMVELDDQSLNVRNNFLKPCRHIRWKSIRTILFKPKRMLVQLDDKQYTFRLPCHIGTMKEIMRAIGIRAAKQGIKVDFEA